MDNSDSRIDQKTQEQLLENSKKVCQSILQEYKAMVDNIRYFSVLFMF